MPKIARKKEEERWQLARLFEALDRELPSMYEDSEKPDFIVPLGGLQIGVEVTWYQTGEWTDDGIPLRNAVGRWEELRDAAKRFCISRPHLHDVTVYLDFKASPPRQDEHNTLLEEISGFVLEHADELGSDGREYGNSHFSTPLMSRYLKELILRPEKYSIWFSRVQGSWVGPPDEALTHTIMVKSRKKYQSTDQLWLAVSSGFEASTVVSPMNGAEDFRSVAGLEDALVASPFDRVFVVTHGDTYEWNKTQQWKKLETKH